MKKIKTIFTSLVLGLGLTASMTACSDSKDDEPATPAAKSIEASYQGDMTCSVMGQESVFENMGVVVKATDDATVSVTLSSFGNPPMRVPEISITGVKVSGTDGTYTLAPTQFSGTTSDGKAYSGTLQGNFAANTITVKFNLQYGAMPMPMICSFTASKK